MDELEVNILHDLSGDITWLKEHNIILQYKCNNMFIVLPGVCGTGHKKNENWLIQLFLFYHFCQYTVV